MRTKGKKKTAERIIYCVSIVTILATLGSCATKAVPSEPVYIDETVKEYDYDPKRVWVAGWQKSETFDVAMYFGSELLKDRVVLRDVEEMLIKTGYTLEDVKRAAERIGVSVDDILEAIIVSGGDKSVLDCILNKATPIGEVLECLRKYCPNFGLDKDKLSENSDVMWYVAPSSEDQVPADEVVPVQKTDALMDELMRLAAKAGVDVERLYGHVAKANPLDPVLAYLDKASDEEIKILLDILDDMDLTLAELADLAKEDGLTLLKLRDNLMAADDPETALRDYISEKLNAKKTPEEVKLEEQNPEMHNIALFETPAIEVQKIEWAETKHEPYEKEYERIDLNEIIDAELRDVSIVQEDYTINTPFVMTLAILGFIIVGIVFIAGMSGEKPEDPGTPNPKTKKGVTAHDVEATAAPIVYKTISKAQRSEIQTATKETEEPKQTGEIISEEEIKPETEVGPEAQQEKIEGTQYEEDGDNGQISDED